ADPAAPAAAAPRTVRRSQPDPGEVGVVAPGPLRWRAAPADDRTRCRQPAGSRSRAARGGPAGLVRRGSAWLPPPPAGEGWGGGKAATMPQRLRRAPRPALPPPGGEGQRTPTSP